MKNTAVTFQEMKKNGEKISMLTCYDYSTAKLIESAGINGVLVGDSLGNTMLGYPDTLSVTMEDMLTYGRSVARGCNDTMVVIDMPFMSYQISVQQAQLNLCPWGYSWFQNVLYLLPQGQPFANNRVESGE